ncbi:speckle targeted PIP5K1A-regulated poly(A) polymerase-like [Mya arenaria]|uniref:speckle targeted PIP5K1A-regulated poly(A) polymerase-like n=1 Tax=Mya arenaria TaxID=6604 RepID=UPI0022E61FCC|nr:speckle targeted PIP5K1A-regulated poly(A) polymerase-like [Mya arenaria]
MNQQGVLHCEVCDAELPNFNSMRWHIQGKRHQKALQHWSNKREGAKLSVFVRNFPRGTTETELWQYFAQFGRVTKVTIVKPQNMFCIIEFSNADTVDYVLNTTNHRLNSQNLIVKPREIQVPGGPPVNQHQYGYQQFQRGGELGSGHRGGRDGGGGRGGGGGMLAAGGYISQGGMGRGMGPGPSGPSSQMDPYWASQSEHAKKKVNVEDQIDQYYHEELIEKLVQVKGVQNQLEWLCQNLQVTAEEAQTKFSLCEKLQTELAKFFPGCTVNQFGSSVNGFGLSGCDMDIFLDLSTMHSRTWETQPIKLPFVRDFKFLKDKEWGPLIPADLSRMGLQDQCKLMCRILTEHLPGIQDPQVIPSNRCPIVRFKYGDNIKCDLSLNNKLALQNTKLLYLYSVLNSRVRLLVYAIRYWGKVKLVSGNNKASTKLSNYALTLMVLNYLQNTDPPVLPTIEKLSQLHGPTGRTKIEGWDCTFAMDWQIIPQSTNNQSAAELLSGFFSYWSAFNFVENILQTRTATEMSFISFFDKDNMEDGRLRSFKASAINVQDPFVLNHNITQNVNEKSRDQIVREFRIAAIKTSVWGNEGFSMTEPSGGGDLIHLLNSEVPEIIQQEDQEKQEAIMQKGRMPSRDKGDYEFEIEMKPTMITPKFLKMLQKGDSGNVRVEWCKRVCAFVLRVLKETLMLIVEELPEATEEMREKLREEDVKMRVAEQHNKQVRERRKARREEKRKEIKEKLEAERKAIEEEQARALEEKQEQAAEGEVGQGHEIDTQGEEGAQSQDWVDTGAQGEEVEEETGWGQEMEQPGPSQGIVPNRLMSLAMGGEQGNQLGQKRSASTSIFDLNVPVPERFKSKRFKNLEMEVNRLLDDSDDGEELIEYKKDEPELRYKRPCDSEVDKQFFMRAWCMTWARRKKGGATIW